MYHGMNPSSGDAFLEQQQQQQQQQQQPQHQFPPRLFAVVLWFQLALCFGPAQLTGGFDDLRACADPGIPEYGSRTPSGSVFFEDSVARFHCQEGYKLRGPPRRLCMKHLNGSLGWIPTDTPVCLPEGPDCRLPYIEDADIGNKTYKHGDKLIISCHEGFKIRYPDLYNMVSTCRSDGSWDNLPICQVCPLPPIVSHGDYICHPRPCDRFNHGTVIEFYCDPGYSLTSDYKYITCQYGEWFPSYQVFCVKSEQIWPNPHETLLTTWKIVAFTATSVLLVLLLVILARMFQTKFKTHFLPRGLSGSSSSDPDFVVVDGVPVMLPSYDEAVSSSLNALAPGYLSSVGQGCPMPAEDQSPPAYPGSGDRDTVPGEGEACDSVSGSSELLQSLYSPSMRQAGPRPVSERTDALDSTTVEEVSTSPSVDIADGPTAGSQINPLGAKLTPTAPRPRHSFFAHDSSSWQCGNVGCLIHASPQFHRYPGGPQGSSQ
ncbi:sushi domain-containing protein 4-like isoform X3 [Vombatus ursinus]|uniref:sushi domain-containing protein 4-like isoform X3 n=1 Tax=Vombatus ursinus TaxID=29139 RepID=UPI000FFD1867|nr:sushi domain-containing protein 4-like isoform X3 [Vombatus ursinus]XP_027727150.1 sushi domain-containing protein 4-like isoform X3 [Vombatus ursinus]